MQYYYTLNRLHYNIKITFTCTRKPNNCVKIYYDINFIAVVWNQTHNISKICLYMPIAIVISEKTPYTLKHAIICSCDHFQKQTHIFIWAEIHLINIIHDDDNNDGNYHSCRNYSH